jgi:predicted Zn-dependent protease
MQANPGLVLGMGPLTRMQELEADALGLLLASRAGYPTAELVRFFEKLADKDGAAGVSESSTHPSGAIRLLYAKAVSQLIGAGMFGS